MGSAARRSTIWPLQLGKEQEQQAILAGQRSLRLGSARELLVDSFQGISCLTAPSTGTWGTAGRQTAPRQLLHSELTTALLRSRHLRKEPGLRALHCFTANRRLTGVNHAPVFFANSSRR